MAAAAATRAAVHVPPNGVPGIPRRAAGAPAGRPKAYRAAASCRAAHQGAGHWTRRRRRRVTGYGGGGGGGGGEASGLRRYPRIHHVRRERCLASEATSPPAGPAAKPNVKGPAGGRLVAAAADSPLCLAKYPPSRAFKLPGVPFKARHTSIPEKLQLKTCIP